ncbi:uncharacterized protein LOC122458725 [Dermochelys coriacea]|uniref:uncharacterized protein LOC122458725 n=1 Tax=Dermochelys coriacea TaxID=27794 RepID=UPI001CA7BEDD|nr:uncharacterized protein LOC122458725 [Dermochelys coriacea]
MVSCAQPTPCILSLTLFGPLLISQTDTWDPVNVEAATTATQEKRTSLEPLPALVKGEEDPGLPTQEESSKGPLENTAHLRSHNPPFLPPSPRPKMVPEWSWKIRLHQLSSPSQFGQEGSGSVSVPPWELGKWWSAEDVLCINLLELRMVRNACAHFLPLFRGIQTKVMTDNTMCIYYINCWERQIIRLLCRSAKAWEWVHFSNVLISVTYLPGVQNTTMDHLSRKFPHDHRWEMNPAVPDDIFCQWWIQMIGLFATYLNKKRLSYCSRAGLRQHSFGDALLLPWNFYMPFPHSLCC